MYIILETYIDKMAHLTDEEHYRINSICEIRAYGRYEKLHLADQYEESFHFITKGIVRKFTMKEEEDITLFIAQEGEFIAADPTLFSDQPSHYQLETLEPTTTLSISKKLFLELYYHYPGIQQFARALMIQMLVQSEQHELEQVKYSLRERMSRFIEKYPHFMTRVPQKILASYLNIQPETFSRLKAFVMNKDTSMEFDNSPLTQINSHGL